MMCLRISMIVTPRDNSSRTLVLLASWPGVPTYSYFILIASLCQALKLPNTEQPPWESPATSHDSVSSATAM